MSRRRIRTSVPTASPTIDSGLVPDDHQVFSAEIFWLSLSLGLVFLYALLRRYVPWTMVLRDLPWTSKREEEKSCQNDNFLTHFVDSVRRTLALRERDLIQQCGLDGYLTIRLVRFCMETIVLMTMVSLVILTPVYHSQVRTEKCEKYCATHNSTSQHGDAYKAECVCGVIDSCSMANVRAGSSVLWLSALSMFVFTMWILYRLKREYKEVVRIRHEFWSSRPSRLHSVFVDRIPRSLAPPKRLKEYFEKLFPGQIHSVELLSPIEALRQVGRQRMYTLMLLERAIALKAREGRHPRHWVLCSACRSPSASTTVSPSSLSSRMCCLPVDGFCKTMDSIEVYASQLEMLNSQFKMLKDRYVTADASLDEYTRPRQAFVTFKNVTPTLIAAQTLIQEDMVVKMAPDPNDVRWDTLGERNTAFSHFVRKTASRVLFAFVVVFWGALTSFVGAFTSRKALAEQFEGLNDFLRNNPDFIVWLDRLSTLIYVILIAIVYPIIVLSVKFEVRIAQSNMERAIFERYFLFLVVQVFVFYSIAGSVFMSVVEIARNPSHIFTTLSATIPKNAQFFIGFVAVKTFWLLFDLIRGYNVIFAALRRIFYGKTITQKEFRYQALGICWDFRFPSPVNLSSANANVLLVFFIATSYAAIQPLLTSVALIYFIAANLVFSVILTTSSRQLSDGGGIFWTHSYWCIVASVVTAQLTLVGTLLTKQGFSQALFVFGLCVFTLVMSSHLNDKYRNAATDCTLEIASELDKMDQADSNRQKKIVEVMCDTVFDYGLVMRHRPERALDDIDEEIAFAAAPSNDFITEEDGTETEVPRQSPSLKGATKVFRYVHPVLHEHEFVSPELPSYTRGRGELGEARGSTGGDLGYARMLDLDLDWNSTGISTANTSSQALLLDQTSST